MLIALDRDEVKPDRLVSDAATLCAPLARAVASVSVQTPLALTAAEPATLPSMLTLTVAPAWPVPAIVGREAEIVSPLISETTAGVGGATESARAMLAW